MTFPRLVDTFLKFGTLIRKFLQEWTEHSKFLYIISVFKYSGSLEIVPGILSIYKLFFTYRGYIPRPNSVHTYFPYTYKPMRESNFKVRHSERL